MRLTQHILSQISYWEHTKVDITFWHKPACRFTLHFKQWWKPRKTITIPWICVGISGNIHSFRCHESSIELERQLKTIP
jgi:hypothetical protein